MEFNAGFWKSHRGVHFLPYIRLIKNSFVFLIQRCND